ncbi:MAG: hypothetical protein KAR17_08870, partial [Cyclobacteriaceae bacterium]|nr:hypothetical protein [Cyclobacteriaceae bacterium]
PERDNRSLKLMTLPANSLLFHFFYLLLLQLPPYFLPICSGNEFIIQSHPHSSVFVLPCLSGEAGDS